MNTCVWITELEIWDLWAIREKQNYARLEALKNNDIEVKFPTKTRHYKKTTCFEFCVPEQQLQLGIQESNQRPPAEDFGVAVAERSAAVASIVRVQTLGPRGQ